MKNKILVSAFLFHVVSCYSIPQYICTGATSNYFGNLLGLIGSLHSTNFRSIKEIAVYDFGLTPDQKKILKRIKKVKVYQLEKTNPHILDFFTLPNGNRCFGWYAWKACVIKQALQKFPYVLWLDAGTTILKPIDNLFSYIDEHGYFLCTIGDDLKDGDHCLHTVGWGTTQYIYNKFELGKPENQWILTQESIMGGVIGVKQTHQDLFLNDLYELSNDLRNYADDGTAPNGWGTGRHDQTLMSILAYSRGLTVFKQDYTQALPMYLNIRGQDFPFHITWERNHVCDKTSIYSSRGDTGNYQLCIRYKKKKQ